MKHVCWLIAIAAIVLTGEVRAQTPPDFSGLWTLDASRSDSTGTYGTVRFITQTAEEVNMVVLQRERFYPEISVIPWQLRIGRYGPRRGGERSREPLVQARWDGDELIILKAPGETYSVLWMWRLGADGNELVVESIDTGMPSSFDFKRSSIPRAYAPYRHVYVRVPTTSSCADCPFQIDATGLRSDLAAERGVVLRLQSATNLSVACLEKTCSVTEIIGGRRRDVRRLSAGRAATVSLTTQSAIGVPD
jgi:hypothetical protein